MSEPLHADNREPHWILQLRDLACFWLLVVVYIIYLWHIVLPLRGWLDPEQVSLLGWMCLGGGAGYFAGRFTGRD